jgi:hypothetical protein
MAARAEPSFSETTAPFWTGGAHGELRLHGFGALWEACVQLRREGGARQVPNHPEVAAVTSGAETFTSCLLLTG